MNQVSRTKTAGVRRAKRIPKRYGFLHTAFACQESTTLELLSLLYRTGVRVTKHSMGNGINRRLWVVSFSIPASGVSREDGEILPWPPAEAERDAIGAAIGYVLRREGENGL